jgi:alkylation response protein AidB-like acyl-CoA dehydrogenase
MEFGLNEQQEMLKKTARDFFQDKLPRTLVRTLMWEDPKGYSPELWKEMAELGWMGIMFPEEYEGFGGDFIDLTVILEEMGRALLTGPFIPTVVFGGTAVLNAGTAEQKKAILPAIASGNLIMTFALQDSADRFDAAGVTTSATADADGYVIKGTKRLVPEAHVADKIICVARTGSGSKPEEGITLFIVDAKSPGVNIKEHITFDGKRLCDVNFESVKVSKADVLGPVGQGWPILEKALQYTIVAMCADAVGGCQMVMEMSSQYAKERIQFDRPIGTFQAVKHKCANMFIDVEAIRPLTYWAAWAVDTGAAEAPVAVSMAKAYCNDAYRRITADGIQVHGGIGFTWEHDMHLFHKRAKTMELNYGDSHYHRAIVADDLARSVATA